MPAVSFCHLLYVGEPFQQGYPRDRCVRYERCDTYYPSWLSGFMEAESCFSMRVGDNSDVSSFSIGQKNDKYLIGSIKKLFNAIRTPSKNFL
mgnify:CR=1 FL=1